MPLKLWRGRATRKTAPGWSPIKLATHAMAPLDAIAFVATETMVRLLNREGRGRSWEGVSSIRPNGFVHAVYSRLSELSGMPFDALYPRVVHTDRRIFQYDKNRHEITLHRPRALSDSDHIMSEEHEGLHGTQYLLGRLRGKSGGIGYARQHEPTVTAMSSPHNLTGLTASTSFAAAISIAAATNAEKAPLSMNLSLAIAGVHTAVDYSRILMTRRAMRKYGPDGWIALHAYGRFDPLFSGAILEMLESRGFLKHDARATPGAWHDHKTFTPKGEQWIASLVPSIRQKLIEVQANRARAEHPLD